MPAVYVPGTALVSMQGLIGAQPWATVHHFQFGTQTARWTQGDLTLLGTTINSAFASHLASLCGLNVQLTKVSVADLTDNQSLSAEIDGPVQIGTRSGNHDPASLCVLVQNTIQSRFRGGHPRTYWPFGIVTDVANESNWNTLLTDPVGPQVAQFFAEVTGAAYTVTGAPLEHKIVRYTYTVTNDEVHKKYVRERSGLMGTFSVKGYVAKVPIASQRKRLTLG